MLDILIKNGLIVDGTNTTPYHADMGIKDGKIISIEKNLSSEANDVIDASRLIVCPGFIDVHSHNDLVPFTCENLRNSKLLQGVTTELVGQCGLGIFPYIESQDNAWKNYVVGIVGGADLKWHFSDLNEYMAKINSMGLKNNYASLISQGAVRTNVMGFDPRIPTQCKIDHMCRLVDDAMRKGAFGMSLGLQYMPGIFSCRDELIAMCKVVKSYNGIVMVHVRNHDNTINNALEEIISIARESKVKLQISHMRSYNSSELGLNADSLIKIVQKAIDDGIDITFDEHPYLSGSTLMTQLLPPWLTKEGEGTLLEKLKDVQVLNRVKNELSNTKIHYPAWDNYSAIAGWDGILITSLKKDKNLKYIGKTVGDISRDLGIHPVDFISKLLIEENAGVGIVTLNIFSEEDTIKLIQHPLQMVCSDSIPAGVPHPRFYGNYPLFIGKFVREKKAISLENAIYKSTLFPAVTLGLKDIGKLAPNNMADITIFDFDKIIGYEDYKNPTKSPIGVKYVLLNGKLAVKNGVVCKGNYGRVIRHT
ncbi:N-acyl-D-amino-acid deacylase family protein [Clostridium autoethanogenum]|uniref:D-aminoacylase n=2 Tax=Clostridium autoethanogenum TaxID=84023 RepID=A0A3M0SQQ6_9CLOT|nr:D-aminoacylase [Clostridium autoethanogenum]AGY74681.1 D-aminoacylase [Clostridium autoethanogenum DSM 10061]ALU34862.1 N-acyl-D-amino-acid deacylase [Clostridium autoethanogenum DSM 10061]OVY51583.1 N-acyl-D-glutamate deacylase [Clostridium autoethanogenum]RMC96907.1 D-aminoacylase [Clostridium autoethanogenum]